MRFIANGPILPDELLRAQDEEQVVFFCGSGVSRARAHLPDFQGLAASVITSLGGPDELIAGQSSTDRVFGQLERLFTPEDINQAVVQALRPPENVDLTAHKTMLRLARLKYGQTRLITTNFDLLFESCDKQLQPRTRSNLPNIQFTDNNWGIVHLHGKVHDDYSGPDRDGFVLSSAEFGDAYLANGWARDFILDVLDRHIAVFVGYSADDPPIRYLLEGLRKSKRHLHKIYAFQPGPNLESSAQWHEKGAIPLTYELGPNDSHEALWATLEAWATRTKDVAAWRRKVFAMARKGPSKLLPHERGMIAHLVSSQSGAYAFAHANPPLPSDWLCVFDAAIRFARPSKHDLGGEEVVDPNALFSLDDDPIAPNQNDEFSNSGEAPKEAWNAFTLNASDFGDLNDRNLAHLRGHFAYNLPQLPPRLFELAHWISSVAHEPSCVWWAARQFALHQDVIAAIRWKQENDKDKSTLEEIRKAWHALFEYNEQPKLDDRYTYIGFKHVIRNGWTPYATRQYGRLFAPLLKISPSYSSLPPKYSRQLRRRDFLRGEISYPKEINRVVVPDAYLPTVVAIQRANLERAVGLELDYTSYLDLCSIEPQENSDDDEFSRRHGISGYVLHFVALFRRLVAFDPEAAKREFSIWTINDQIFVRIKIWAANFKSLTSEKEYADLICSLSGKDFWPLKGKRDLLLGLAGRWNDLEDTDKIRIERRILRGPARWQGATKERHIEHSAHESLSRLHWLAKQGCVFVLDLKKKTEILIQKAPGWRSEYADKAADTHDGKGGWVKTDTNWVELASLPITEIAETSRRLGGRRDFESLTDFKPFAGLCDERPGKALGVIAFEQKLGRLSVDLWETFLGRERRKVDKPRVHLLAALNLLNLPNTEFEKVTLTVSRWFEISGPYLRSRYPDVFVKVWKKFIETLRTSEEAGGSALVRKESDVDWATEAINSPAGNLAELLMNDPLKDGLKGGQGFPAEWKALVEELLGLPSDSRQYALVILTFNLNWSYLIDPVWTDETYLKLLDEDEAQNKDKDAIWAGIMWSAKIPMPKLFIRLKPYFLRMGSERTSNTRRHAEILSGILLAGWDSKDDDGIRFIESGEYRSALLNSDAEFLSHTLWNLDHWSGDGNNKRPRSVLEFIREVWPKHKKVRTPKVSARLCEIALSQEENFPEVTAEVVKLVTRIEDEHVLIPELRKPQETQAHRYPKDTLDLLYAILPSNISMWPYGASGLIKVIEEVAPALLRDPKLIELKSRMNEP
jgi:hypothetical protein